MSNVRSRRNLPRLRIAVGGAFLGKAHYFNQDKNKAPLLPNPIKPASTKASMSRETPNLGLLQKKVEDLEKVHKEDKRLHKAEVDRFKLELVVALKSNTDLKTRLDKQKKHEDALISRVAELVRLGASEKSEIKELRAKLRSVEHERAQLASKQTDIGDLKKGLQSADFRRKEEVKEREKKIDHLQKSLTAEKTRREMAESCLMEVRNQARDDVDAIQATLRERLTELTETRLLLQHAKTAEDAAISERDFLSTELEQHQNTAIRMAEAYSTLSLNTVPKEMYSRIHFAHLATQWHLIRLERKLANAEGQVVELTHLLRQMKENGLLAKSQISDLQEELRSFWIPLLNSSSSPIVNDTLEQDAAQLHQSLLEFTLDSCHAEVILEGATSQLEHLLCNELLSSYRLVNEELSRASSANNELSYEVKGPRTCQSQLSDELSTAKADRGTSQRLLDAATALSETLRHSSEQFKLDINRLEDRLKEEARQYLANIQKEKDATHQLRLTVQKHLMAEEGLRTQIDLLTSELANVEQLQESYQQLSDKVGDLLAKKALAEDVAKQLSKFNAEIVGNRNPAQRILYLERIRNELAELRQKLIFVSRERDALLAQRQELTDEIDIYKSVAANKPRSMITRVNRMPLASLNQPVVSQLNNLDRSTCILDMIPDVTQLQEMTLAELTIR